MKLRTIGERDHTVDNVLAENLVRITTDLRESLFGPICVIIITLHVKTIFFGLIRILVVLGRLCFPLLLLVGRWNGFRRIARWRRLQLDQTESSSRCGNLSRSLNSLLLLLHLLLRVRLDLHWIAIVAYWVSKLHIIVDIVDVLWSFCLFILSPDFQEDNEWIEQVVGILDHFVCFPDALQLAMFLLMKLLQLLGLSRWQGLVAREPCYCIQQIWKVAWIWNSWRQFIFSWHVVQLIPQFLEVIFQAQIVVVLRVILEGLNNFLVLSTFELLQQYISYFKIHEVCLVSHFEYFLQFLFFGILANKVVIERFLLVILILQLLIESISEFASWKLQIVLNHVLKRLNQLFNLAILAELLENI